MRISGSRRTTAWVTRTRFCRRVVHDPPVAVQVFIGHQERSLTAPDGPHFHTFHGNNGIDGRPRSTSVPTSNLDKPVKPWTAPGPRTWRATTRRKPRTTHRRDPGRVRHAPGEGTGEQPRLVTGRDRCARRRARAPRPSVDRSPASTEAQPSSSVRPSYAATASGKSTRARCSFTRTMASVCEGS